MIKRIVLNNFKGHTGEFVFSPNMNKIKGPNEAGKTTLKDAINFIFFGTDSEFAVSTDHLISNGEASTEVVLETAKSIMTRKKRRGATSQLKMSINGAPPIEVSQTDLESRMLQLDRDVFTSSWMAGHFMTLSGEDRLHVFSRIGKLDRKQLLLSELPPGFEIPTKIKLEEIAVDVSVTRNERTQLQNILKSDEGALSEVVARINELSQAGDIDRNGAIARIGELQGQAELWTDYEKVKAKYEQYLQNMKEHEEKLKTADKRKLAYVAAKQAASEREAAAEQILKLFTPESIKALHAKGEALEASKPAFPVAPKKPNLAAGHCEACHQAITEEHVKQIMAQYDQDLQDYNRCAADVNQKHLDINAQKLEAIKEVSHAEKEASAARFEMQVARSAYDQASAELSGLDEEKAGTKKPRKVELPEPPACGDLAQITEELTTIKSQLQQYDQKQAGIGSLMERQKLLTSSIEYKKAQCEKLYLLEKKLEYLPVLEADTLSKTLSLDGGKLSVQKFKRKVNGQMIDRGELLVLDENGVDYRSLSAGRRMRMDIELCHKIRSMAGARAPKLLFVDNWDLMDRSVPQPEGIQVMVTEVALQGSHGVVVETLD